MTFEARVGGEAFGLVLIRCSGCLEDTPGFGWLGCFAFPANIWLGSLSFISNVTNTFDHFGWIDCMRLPISHGSFIVVSHLSVILIYQSEIEHLVIQLWFREIHLTCKQGLLYARKSIVVCTCW